MAIHTVRQRKNSARCTNVCVAGSTSVNWTTPRDKFHRSKHGTENHPTADNCSDIGSARQVLVLQKVYKPGSRIRRHERHNAIDDHQRHDCTVSEVVLERR